MLHDRLRDRVGSRRPVVGVSSWLRAVRWELDSFNELNLGAQVAMIERAYLSELYRAGVDVLVVPPTADAAQTVIERLDGLVLSGGEDVNPQLYGSDPGPNLIKPSDDRDTGDLALAEAALAHDIPILGICRGCQILNVACGGTLVQHLPDISDEPHMSPEPHPDLHGAPFLKHDVHLVDGTLLAESLGPMIEVWSSHHQAVDRVGRGLEVAGLASDGTIEAVWNPDRRFAVGVQWHPEVAVADPVFRVFGDAAAAHRRRTLG